jgi:hypothetical protein
MMMMLPPSFIDFALARGHAEGVLLAGCRSGECHFRLGDRYTEERIAGQRDPALRERVPRNRIALSWRGTVERGLRRADAGSLSLLPQIRLAGRNSLYQKRESPRRREGDGFLGEVSAGPVEHGASLCGPAVAAFHGDVHPAVQAAQKHFTCRLQHHRECPLFVGICPVAIPRINLLCAAAAGRARPYFEGWHKFRRKFVWF